MLLLFFPFLLWCNIFISNDSLYSANYGLELVLRVHFYRGCNIIILQCVLTISFKTFSTSWIMHIQMHTYTPIVQLKLINATSVDFNQFYWIHAKLSTCKSPKVKFNSIVNALFWWICYCNWAKVVMITAHISPMHTTSVVQYEMCLFFPAISTLNLKKEMWWWFQKELLFANYLLKIRSYRTSKAHYIGALSNDSKRYSYMKK